MSFDHFHDGLSGAGLDGAEVCVTFQFDLSCIVDGELDERAAASAMVHLEECEGCRAFFADARRQARMHREVGDPDRLLAHVAMLTGRGAGDVEVTSRLASIFYQLGKAYVLTALDPDFHRRVAVFEAPVPVEDTRRRGRGFVDGVLLGGRAPEGRVDWRDARGLLNGRLERIQDPLAKGRRLLEEAIAVDPSHEEARLHLANVHRYQGRPIQALETYRSVFDEAMGEANRAHAAVQIGRLYKEEGNLRQALVYWRWVTCSGLADLDARFWFVRFNIALAHALAGRTDRSLETFRLLLDRHPDRAGDVARAIAQGHELREAAERDPRLAEGLVRSCPELFQEAGPLGA